MPESGSLRDQHTEFTRQLLLEAARRVMTSSEPDAFSMQKVAEEAGVSHRTVYRYFPTRQALVDEFANWLSTQSGDQGRGPEDVEHLGESVHSVFAMFESRAEYYEAAARISGGDLRPSNQAERTARLRASFDRKFPNLDPDSANKAFAILRMLSGLQSWFTLHDRFALGDGEPADAVSWAVEELVGALKQGRVPASSSNQVPGRDNSGPDEDSSD